MLCAALMTRSKQLQLMRGLTWAARLHHGRAPRLSPMAHRLLSRGMNFGPGETRSTAKLIYRAINIMICL